MTLPLNKYNFSSRFISAFASDRYDQIQTSLIRRLSDVVWEIGFFDGTQFFGDVHLKVSSVFKDIDYLDLRFRIKTFGNKPIRVYFSHLLDSQIDRYSRVGSDGISVEYLFDENVVNDPARWYSIWSQFNSFNDTLERSVDFDVLRFTCEINGNSTSLTFENFIQFKNLTYSETYVSGGFDAQIDKVELDTALYSFVFGNLKEGGLTTAEYDYIKTHFRNYHYFLIMVDDFGNHQLVKEDTVFTMSDSDTLTNGKIVRSFQHTLEDNLFADSLILICDVNFDVNNELLKNKVSVAIKSHEFSFFDPKLDVREEIGNFSIGENYEQNRSIEQVMIQKTSKVEDIVYLKDIYKSVENVYGVPMIPFDVESMFVKIGIENQSSYYLHYLILTSMKNAISYWDNLVTNNVREMKIENGILMWQFLDDSGIGEFLIQLHDGDVMQPLQRSPKGTYRNETNGYFEFELNPDWWNKRDGIFGVRIMQINLDGTWAYSPEISFLYDTKRVQSDQSFFLDYSFIDKKDPFRWEQLRNVFGIDWDIWSLIIKTYFLNNQKYSIYQLLFSDYVLMYWGQYISFNQKLSFKGMAPGMRFLPLKRENPYWDTIVPFQIASEMDVTTTYAKFKTLGYPSIYLRTAFILAECYHFNETQVIFDEENRGGIQALIYKKTFAESLNNLGFLVPTDYKFLKNSVYANELFDIIPVYTRSDQKVHPTANMIQFWDFSDTLDQNGFFDSVKYNDYIESEFFFIMFFIDTTIYTNHHIKFSLVTPTGVTLNRTWWDDKAAGDSLDRQRGYMDDFLSKRFNKQIVYWDSLPTDLVQKYTPDQKGTLKSIEDGDLDRFYNKKEITNVTSISL